MTHTTPQPAALSEEQILACLESITHEAPKRLPPGWLKFARAVERAALASQPPAPAEAGRVVPDGWRLVPVEPTPEMIKAACLDSNADDLHLQILGYVDEGTFENSYRAMLAAAPQPEPAVSPPAPPAVVPAEAQWRDIESAPKDGFLLVHEDGAMRTLLRINGVWHKPGYPAIISHPWVDVLVGDDAKRLLPPGFRLELRDGCCETPTHWMPLPPAPALSASASGTASAESLGAGKEQA